MAARLAIRAAREFQGRLEEGHYFHEKEDEVAWDALFHAASDMPEEAGDLRSRDAVLALVALGYKQDQARKRVTAVLQEPNDELTVEEIVKKALNG